MLTREQERQIEQALEKTGNVEGLEYIQRLKNELRSKVDYIREQDEIIDDYKHRAEVAEKECDEWKERAERMHKEALKQKQRVSDSKHSEDALRNQIECAMDMVSEMEHAKRALEILYMSGVITEEALRDAVKQSKLEIEEEEADDR